MDLHSFNFLVYVENTSRNSFAQSISDGAPTPGNVTTQAWTVLLSSTYAFHDSHHLPDPTIIIITASYTTITDSGQLLLDQPVMEHPLRHLAWGAPCSGLGHGNVMPRGHFQANFHPKLFNYRRTSFTHWNWCGAPRTGIGTRALRAAPLLPSLPSLLTILHTQECKAHSGDRFVGLSVFSVCATTHAWLFLGSQLSRAPSMPEPPALPGLRTLDYIMLF